jgi:hypothetical protein
MPTRCVLVVGEISRAQATSRGYGDSGGTTTGLADLWYRCRLEIHATRGEPPRPAIYHKRTPGGRARTAAPLLREETRRGRSGGTFLWFCGTVVALWHRVGRRGRVAPAVGVRGRS